MEHDERDEIRRYASHISELAMDLNLPPEAVVSALVLRRLDSISTQLYSQGYHRGYVPTVEQTVSPTVQLRPKDQERRWQSPATAQRLVD